MQSRNVRQPCLIALALLIGMSSLGHLFAAAFCPSAQGRACCPATSVRFRHDSSPTLEDMAMDEMPMNHMSMHGVHDMSAMDGMMMDETGTRDMSAPSSTSNVYSGILDDALGRPTEPCPHCLSHSGVANTPASSVKTPEESRKAVDSAPLPASRFMAPPVITTWSKGFPREHAPPGTGAPRHILISVFLI